MPHKITAPTDDKHIADRSMWKQIIRDRAESLIGIAIPVTVAGVAAYQAQQIVRAFA